MGDNVATLITGQMLIDKFLSFGDVPYAWGGASPVIGWDCSGACNNIAGYQFHLSIPGIDSGGFNPFFEHGPVVADWIQWSGVTRGNFPHTTPVPGDLIAWGPNVHMGMAINATQFRSAANPTDGTITADIDGFFNYAPYVLRLLQVRTGATLPDIPRPPGPGADDYSPTVRNTSSQINGAGLDAYRASRAIASLRR